MQLTHQTLNNLSRALLELHSQQDFSQLPQHLIRIVQNLVPTDISTYNEIDRSSGQLRAVHDFPGDAEKHFPAFMTHVAGHPMMKHVFQTGDTAALRTSDFISQRGFEQTVIFKEFYQHFNIRFQMGVWAPPFTGSN